MLLLSKYRLLNGVDDGDDDEDDSGDNDDDVACTGAAALAAGYDCQIFMSLSL